LKDNKHKLFKFPEVGVPFFWPFAFFLGLGEAAAEVLRENVKFLNEIEKTQIERPEPKWTTKNKIILDLHTLNLRDFSTEGEQLYTLVAPPYAGHTSIIADFSKGQSLVETLRENGVKRVCSIEWKSATEEMKNYDIDKYLSELNICIDDLGGVVNLIGLCQGGWLSAMYAARFPKKVNTLVLAGAPIDTEAGEGKIKEYAHTFSMEFYEELVALGGGILKGEFMLQGFKSMHPEKQYVEKFVDLYEHIDDPKYLKRFEEFERWYEYTIDLPGRLYLQIIKELFKENRLFKGEFIGLGRRLNLRDIKCPVYLLGGERDDITPEKQVFNAEKHLGTDKSKIVKDIATGGHIGLFMGTKPLRENWLEIAKWIRTYSER
jgi:poly(3-hydroxybutyrate) depolymerase